METSRQVDGEEVGERAGGQRAGGNCERLRTIHRRAVEEPRREGLLADPIEDRTLLVLQSQVIVELARILQRIDLRLAVGTQSHANTGAA